VKACWDGDPDRGTILEEYLWALAECAANAAEAEALLKPACDLWASLPDESDEEHRPSPRVRVIEFGVRWAFQRKIPEAAIPYLIERAKTDELKWPITFLFEGIDHPDSIEFMVREIARREAELEGTGQFWPYSSHVTRDFTRRQDETGQAMSERTRSRLAPLWRNESEDKYLRKCALRFWSATKDRGDLDLLRNVTESDALFDQVLWQRIRRRDPSAVPALLEKLRSDRTGYWWQLGRDYWTDEMTDALDAALAKRSKQAASPEEPEQKEGGPDWILSEMVMNLPAGQAETLLLRYWPSLRDSDNYVAAALFFATPALLAAVADAVRQSAAPQDLFKYLLMRAGRTRGKSGQRTGFYQVRQIEAIRPYLDYLSDSDIHRLWDTCNKQGWHSLRRQHLDGRLSEEWRSREYLSEARAVLYLDKTLADTHPWIDHWVDQCLESGWSRDQLLDLIARWCAEKRTAPALEILASALVHSGTRKHIAIAKIEGVIPAGEAEATRTDTAYAVMRRTLA